jgi:hypothetical protein
MKRIGSATLALAALVGGLSLAPRVSADQPIGAGFHLDYAKTEGLASTGETVGGDSRVLVTLVPGSKELREHHLAVVFPGCGRDPQVGGRPMLNLEDVIAGKAAPEYNAEWQDPGPRWSACPDRFVAVIAPGGKETIDLEVDFLRCTDEGLSPRLRGEVFLIDGRMAEQIARDGSSATLLLGERQPDSEVVIDTYYRMSAGCEWAAGTYASVFGTKAKYARVRSYDKDAETLPVNLLSFRRNMRVPGSQTDDGGARLKQTIEAVRSRGSRLAGDQVCYAEDYEVNPIDEGGVTKGTETAGEGAVQALAATVKISGRFSTKWTADHSLHPAWGFRVFASAAGSNPSVWVQSDGRWSLNIPAGVPYTIQYRSYTNYYKPQNQAGNTYAWAHSFPATVNSTDIGHWYADTDGGTFNGLGELVDAAMWMWSRLYWNGGINPVPATPLTLWFPNTWDDCGDGSGNPWSCANTSGEIWLIATHGTQADVVTHEMSHQLNNKYWENKRPAGSGGSHTLTGCYPTRLGMALREGFADFMPAWIGYPDRNVGVGGFGSGRWALDLDGESNTSPPSCANGWENETWVARTFWDLHDTAADNDDVLWFNHLGAVPAIYLSNGIANNGDARDMRDYEAIYRDAASNGHEGYITDIFEQNRM